MAPSTRRNSALLQRITNLQMRLAPLVPLPIGPPHPCFPKTLMAFHLLTEDQLDSLAHYYHQSTPGVWSNSYPANMNWNKDFLARRPSPATANNNTAADPGSWLEDILHTVNDIQSPTVVGDENPYARLSDKQRIRIKRRKVGRFIGLMGMETPVEEIVGRVRASLDAAVERSRAEMRRNEEAVLGRRKIG